MMRDLARDMQDLTDTCRREIHGVFDSDDYTHRIERVMRDVQETRQALTDELEQEAQKEGFTLTFNQMGITPVPLTDGRPMTQEEFNSVPDALREEFRQKAERVQHAVTHAMPEFRKLDKEAVDRTKEVDVELVRYTLTPIIDELQTKYAGHPDVVAYLDQVESDMVEHLEIFKAREDSPAPPTGLPDTTRDEDVFGRYGVDDLVDNTTCEGRRSSSSTAPLTTTSSAG